MQITNCKLEGAPLALGRVAGLGRDAHNMHTRGVCRKLEKGGPLWEQRKYGRRGGRETGKRRWGVGFAIGDFGGEKGVGDSIVALPPALPNGWHPALAWRHVNVG